MLAVALFLPLVKAGEWTDRSEYELVLAIRSEGSPIKRLELLDAWNKKYPNTSLRFAQLELLLSAYQLLADRPHMLDIARQMVASQPANPVGLYWTTVLTPESAGITPEVLDTGEKAARALLRNLNTWFSAEAAAPSAADGEVGKQKSSVELAAHRTLGWIAWQRGNYSAAGQEFQTCVKADPHNAELSAWLGMVSGLDKGKQSAALWHLAHALAPGQTRPLTGEQHRQTSSLLDQMYASYHGSPDGLDDLRTQAAASPFPPDVFSIEPATVVAARRMEEELSRTNPPLAAWLTIRRRLGSADADKYFTEVVRPQPLPKLRGAVLRCSPPRNPQEVVLAMTEAGTEDVVLRLSSPLPASAEVGTRIDFEGTADSFRTEPFALTVLTDPAKIDGWPKAGSKARK